MGLYVLNNAYKVAVKMLLCKHHRQMPCILQEGSTEITCKGQGMQNGSLLKTQCIIYRRNGQQQQAAHNTTGDHVQY